MKKLAILTTLFLTGAGAYADDPITGVLPTTTIHQADADKTFADRHPVISKIGRKTKEVTKPAWRPVVCVTRATWNEKHVKAIRGDVAAIEHKAADSAKIASAKLDPYSGLMNAGGSVLNGIGGVNRMRSGR